MATHLSCYYHYSMQQSSTKSAPLADTVLIANAGPEFHGWNGNLIHTRSMHLGGLGILPTIATKMNTVAIPKHYKV
eukprot:1929059-Amphidinium_carterae.1